MKTVEEFRNESDKFLIFEIEVIDQRTNESNYITFDIDWDQTKMTAQHEALSEIEEQSEKIAFKSIDIDNDFSLDYHFQELHEECTNAIINSEFYTLAD